MSTERSDDQARVEQAEGEQAVARVWRRLEAGQHTAVIGEAAPLCAMGADSTVRLVVQDCGVHPQPLGAMSEAQRRLGALVGELRGELRIPGGAGLGLLPGLDVAADRVLSGLRRRLIGEQTEPLLSRFVQTLDLLGQSSVQMSRRWVVAFTRVERADADTLHLLTLLAARRLAVPLLLVFSTDPKSGPAHELLIALRRSGGEEAVIQLTKEQRSPVERELPVPTLPSQVLQVLRGLAIAGAGCELPVLSELLLLPEAKVLACLQEAADAGIAIEDDGEGHFEVQPELARALLAKTLPSVGRAYHRRLAALLSERHTSAVRTTETPRQPSAASNRGGLEDSFNVPSVSESEAAPLAPDPGAAEVSESPVDVPASPAIVMSEVIAPSSDQTPATDQAPDPAASPGAVPAELPLTKQDLTPTLHWPYGDVAASGPSAPDRLKVAPALPTESAPRTPVEVAAPPRAGRSARAARHFIEAGEVDRGIDRYLLAIEQSLRVGALREAMGLVDRAMNLLSELPDNAARRTLRIRVLCALGRIRWLGKGPDARFTLAGALQAFAQARALLQGSDPAELRAQVASQLAAVLCEIGDLPSLEEALTVLTDTTRALLAMGDTAVAARLLNDQAAVYVRVGDPVRAAHLLEESRRFFASSRFAVEDERAALELAETEHLLARLPLHVASRPGRELDAVELGRSHAQDAATTYKRFGMRRELAYVLETLGRLETRAARHEVAVEHLSAAAQIERELHDVLGLARTTAAMADVLASAGQLGGAIALLSESLALNEEKGSPIGLAFVRQSVERIAARLSSAAEPTKNVQERRAVQQLLEAIVAAEQQLGRVRLPADF